MEQKGRDKVKIKLTYREAYEIDVALATMRSDGFWDPPKHCWFPNARGCQPKLKYDNHYMRWAPDRRNSKGRSYEIEIPTQWGLILIPLKELCYQISRGRSRYAKRALKKILRLMPEWGNSIRKSGGTL